MSPVAAPTSRPPVVYPDTDGEPIAENTLQFEWIVKVKGGLDRLFANDPNVFVAADLFWYPVEGRPDIRLAPDAMVAFGRPKGHRMSYLQWREADVAPQVVFEILSPGNRYGEMIGKAEFYRRYGVDEYYIWNPDPLRFELSGFRRRADELVAIPSMNGYVSALLGIRFDLTDDGLQIVGPDGRSFMTLEETNRAVDQERERADQERERADQERERADQERERADANQAEVERLREQLRSQGGDPQ